MMSRLFHAVVCLGLSLSAGCSSFSPLLAAPTPVPVDRAASTPQTPPAQTAVPSSEARILRVWLPPQFDPNADTASAALLKQRLLDFETGHPGLEIDLRIKAEEGEGNLLESLALTSAAAPSALPDLVALPRPGLEFAALNGLLHPIDGLSSAMHDPNWYGYARQLGHVQNIAYGLPFAGNALALVHRPGIEEVNNWEEILASQRVLAFPAGDPQGVVGLSLYASAGGEIVDSTGLPTLDQEALTRVLAFVEDGAAAGVVSPSLANVSSDAQAYQAYRTGNADLSITWTFNNPLDGSFVPLPGLGEEAGHSFATGWVWALAGAEAENQQLAVELGEYLVVDDFLGDWTRAAGYLPTRPSNAVEEGSTVNAIVESAQAIPSNEALSVLGPLMQEALTRVLNGEQHEVVARSVIEKLK